MVGLPKSRTSSSLWPVGESNRIWVELLARARAQVSPGLDPPRALTSRRLKASILFDWFNLRHRSFGAGFVGATVCSGRRQARHSGALLWAPTQCCCQFEWPAIQAPH